MKRTMMHGGARSGWITTALLIALPETGHAQDELFHFDGAPFDTLGPVAAVGDVDDDGTPDLLVGAPLNLNVRIYSGRTRSVLVEIQEPSNEYFFGQFISGLGDFDGDGTTDFAVGDPGRNGAAGLNPGAVHVYSGVDGTKIAFVEGHVPNFELGWSVAGLGDVNGDGFADLGATTNMRRVRIYLGPDARQFRQHEHPSSKQARIAGVGDLDGDGCDDYVIGWPRDTTVGSSAGKAVVHSGRTGVVLHEVFGELPGDFLGLSVTGVGDMDGDGVPDFAVGAPGALCLGGGCGTAMRALARVYSGLDASLLYEWHGSEEADGPTSATGSRFGMWIYGRGDLNGDDVPEILISAPSDASGRGSISAYSGLTGERLWRVVGETSTDDLHHAAILGDVNHDGVDDFAIGNGATTHGGQASGRIYVYGGDSGDLTHHCATAPTSVSPGIAIDASGAISIGNNFLTLQATGAVPNETALFFYGAPAPELPMGDGLLCTAAPHYRLGPPLTVAADGTLERALDFGLPPLGLGPGKVHAGSTWSFQLYCRDPASPGGASFNLSDALAITFPP